MPSPPITAELIQEILDAIRHCKVLGLTVHRIDDQQLTIALPYADTIIGNPDSGVIHGGALTTLLDTTCGMSVPLAMKEFQIAPTLDLRIDYMTSAKPGKTVYGRAEAYRITSNVVFCKGIAFQDDDSKPIAHCVATFMRLPNNVKDSATAGNKPGNKR